MCRSVTPGRCVDVIKTIVVYWCIVHQGVNTEATITISTSSSFVEEFANLTFQCSVAFDVLGDWWTTVWQRNARTIVTLSPYCKHRFLNDSGVTYGYLCTSNDTTAVYTFTVLNVSRLDDGSKWKCSVIVPPETVYSSDTITIQVLEMNSSALTISPIPNNTFVYEHTFLTLECNTRSLGKTLPLTWIRDGTPLQTIEPPCSAINFTTHDDTQYSSVCSDKGYLLTMANVKKSDDASTWSCNVTYRNTTIESNRIQIHIIAPSTTEATQAATTEPNITTQQVIAIDDADDDQGNDDVADTEEGTNIALIGGATGGGLGAILIVVLTAIVARKICRRQGVSGGEISLESGLGELADPIEPHTSGETSTKDDGDEYLQPKQTRKTKAGVESGNHDLLIHIASSDKRPDRRSNEYQSSETSSSSSADMTHGQIYITPASLDREEHHDDYDVIGDVTVERAPPLDKYLYVLPITSRRHIVAASGAYEDIEIPEDVQATGRHLTRASGAYDVPKHVQPIPEEAQATGRRLTRASVVYDIPKHPQPILADTAHLATNITSRVMQEDDDEYLTPFNVKNANSRAAEYVNAEAAKYNANDLPIKTNANGNNLPIENEGKASEKHLPRENEGKASDKHLPIENETKANDKHVPRGYEGKTRDEYLSKGEETVEYKSVITAKKLKDACRTHIQSGENTDNADTEYVNALARDQTIPIDDVTTRDDDKVAAKHVNTETGDVSMSSDDVASRTCDNIATKHLNAASKDVSISSDEVSSSNTCSDNSAANQDQTLADHSGYMDMGSIRRTIDKP